MIHSPKSLARPPTCADSSAKAYKYFGPPALLVSTTSSPPKAHFSDGSGVFSTSYQQSDFDMILYVYTSIYLNARKPVET
jgi:hypothetical protein